eukprot:scaffold1649_cov134-Isochrysis_galbana.AAC.13
MGVAAEPLQSRADDGQRAVDGRRAWRSAANRRSERLCERGESILTCSHEEDIKTDMRTRRLRGVCSLRSSPMWTLCVHSRCRPCPRLRAVVWATEEPCRRVPCRKARPRCGRGQVAPEWAHAHLHLQ